MFVSLPSFSGPLSKLGDLCPSRFPDLTSIRVYLPKGLPQSVSLDRAGAFVRARVGDLPSMQLPSVQLPRSLAKLQLKGLGKYLPSRAGIPSGHALVQRGHAIVERALVAYRNTANTLCQVASPRRADKGSPPSEAIACTAAVVSFFPLSYFPARIQVTVLLFVAPKFFTTLRVCRGMEDGLRICSFAPPAPVHKFPAAPPARPGAQGALSGRQPA